MGRREGRREKGSWRQGMCGREGEEGWDVDGSEWQWLSETRRSEWTEPLSG